ncbi:hypothetical protein Esti_002580 [Eimeria stiedai]
MLLPSTKSFLGKSLSFCGEAVCPAAAAAAVAFSGDTLSLPSFLFGCTPAKETPAAARPAAPHPPKASPAAAANQCIIKLLQPANSSSGGPELAPLLVADLAAAAAGTLAAAAAAPFLARFFDPHRRHSSPRLCSRGLHPCWRIMGRGAPYNFAAAAALVLLLLLQQQQLPHVGGAAAMSRRGPGGSPSVRAQGASRSAARKQHKLQQPHQSASLSCAAPPCMHKQQQQEEHISVSAVEAVTSEGDGWRLRLYVHSTKPLPPGTLLAAHPLEQQQKQQQQEGEETAPCRRPPFAVSEPAGYSSVGPHRVQQHQHQPQQEGGVHHRYYFVLEGKAEETPAAAAAAAEAAAAAAPLRLLAEAASQQQHSGGWRGLANPLPLLLLQRAQEMSPDAAAAAAAAARAAPRRRAWQGRLSSSSSSSSSSACFQDFAALLPPSGILARELAAAAATAARISLHRKPHAAQPLHAALCLHFRGGGRGPLPVASVSLSGPPSHQPQEQQQQKQEATHARQEEQLHQQSAGREDTSLLQTEQHVSSSSSSEITQLPQQQELHQRADEQQQQQQAAGEASMISLLLEGLRESARSFAEAQEAAAAAAAAAYPLLMLGLACGCMCAGVAWAVRRSSSSNSSKCLGPCCAGDPLRLGGSPGASLFERAPPTQAALIASASTGPHTPLTDDLGGLIGAHMVGAPLAKGPLTTDHSKASLMLSPDVAATRLPAAAGDTPQSLLAGGSNVTTISNSSNSSSNSSSSSSSNGYPCAEWAHARCNGEMGTVVCLQPSTAALVFYCPPPPAAAAATAAAAAAAAGDTGPTAQSPASCTSSSKHARPQAAAAAAADCGVWRALVQAEKGLQRADAAISLLGYDGARAAAELAAQRLLLLAAEQRRNGDSQEETRKRSEKEAREILTRLCELLPLECFPAAAALRESCLRLLQWRLLGALLSLLDLVSLTFPQQQQQQQSSSKLSRTDQALLIALLQQHVVAVKQAADPECLFCYLPLLQPTAAAAAAAAAAADGLQPGSVSLKEVSSILGKESYTYTAAEGPSLLHLLLYGISNNSGRPVQHRRQPQLQQQQQQQWWAQPDEPWLKSTRKGGELWGLPDGEAPASGAAELQQDDPAAAAAMCSSNSSLCCGDRTEVIDCSTLEAPPLLSLKREKQVSPQQPH